MPTCSASAASWWRHDRRHNLEVGILRETVLNQGPALARRPTATAPVQCEEFIHIVLQDEPDKYWLYFCLDMIA